MKNLSYFLQAVTRFMFDNFGIKKLILIPVRITN